MNPIQWIYQRIYDWLFPELWMPDPNPNRQDLVWEPRATEILRGISDEILLNLQWLDIS